jgi:pimeloyl-ACP methyl ester carboxylesterase
MLGDLESVVEAAGPDRFALLGISQGGAVASAYAARHPDRVSHLVLYGTYARGWQMRSDPQDAESRRALMTLTRIGWGKENPLFRQLWTSRYIPEGTAEQWDWFNEMQRISTSRENAAAFMTCGARSTLPRSCRMSAFQLSCSTANRTGQSHLKKDGGWLPRFPVHALFRCLARTILCLPMNRRGNCSCGKLEDFSVGRLIAGPNALLPAAEPERKRDRAAGRNRPSVRRR